MPNPRETELALLGDTLTSRATHVTIPPMAQNRISREQVLHVAELARIELTEAEQQQLETDLSNILAYIEKLDQLDTAAVEPTFQVGDAGTPWRDDAVTNHPDADAMLRNAPAREGRLFKVPKIIE